MTYKMKKTKNSINFVAEVGCNHQGNMRLALKMIDKLVNFCDVKYVKFQKRNNRELVKAPFHLGYWLITEVLLLLPKNVFVAL